MEHATTHSTAGPSTAAATRVAFSAMECSQPELAATVRRGFEAHRHHVLATLTADGSPRVSGTEVMFIDGEMLVGSMWKARKALDLLRDGRYALHADPADEQMRLGDVKVAGVAQEADDELRRKVVEDLDPPSPFHLFRLAIGRATVSTVDRDREVMVIRSWTPDGGLVVTER